MRRVMGSVSALSRAIKRRVSCVPDQAGQKQDLPQIVRSRADDSFHWQTQPPIDLGCVHQGGVRVGPDERYRRVVAE